MRTNMQDKHRFGGGGGDFDFVYYLILMGRHICTVIEAARAAV